MSGKNQLCYKAKNSGQIFFEGFIVEDLRTLKHLRVLGTQLKKNRSNIVLKEIILVMISDFNYSIGHIFYRALRFRILFIAISYNLLKKRIFRAILP